MRIIRSTRRLATPIFEVHDILARDPDGFEIRRSVVEHKGSAVVLPVDAAGQILLVRQFRLPVSDSLWELCAGRIDPGEKPLAAARRELAEETGLRAARWTKLAKLYPTPGYVSELMHVYLATELRDGNAAPMEDERIETRWFTRKEIERLIDRGKLPDAKTIAAILLYWRITSRVSSGRHR